MNRRDYSKYLHALTASAVVVAPITSEANSFKDVQRTHPFYKENKNLNDRGIMNGFQDGTFKPEQNLTRGQAAKIIAGVLELATLYAPNVTLSLDGLTVGGNTVTVKQVKDRLF